MGTGWIRVKVVLQEASVEIEQKKFLCPLGVENLVEGN